MLSFGHAVYYGLGGFLAIHAMNCDRRHDWPVPLPLIPLVGGIAGLLFAVLSRLGARPSARARRSP